MYACPFAALWTPTSYLSGAMYQSKTKSAWSLSLQHTLPHDHLIHTRFNGHGRVADSCPDVNSDLADEEVRRPSSRSGFTLSPNRRTFDLPIWRFITAPHASTARPGNQPVCEPQSNPPVKPCIVVRQYRLSNCCHCSILGSDMARYLR